MKNIQLIKVVCLLLIGFTVGVTNVRAQSNISYYVVDGWLERNNGRAICFVSKIIIVSCDNHPQSDSVEHHFVRWYQSNNPNHQIILDKTSPYEAASLQGAITYRRDFIREAKRHDIDLIKLDSGNFEYPCSQSK